MTADDTTLLEPKTAWERLAEVAGLEPLIDLSIGAQLVPVKPNTLLKFLNRRGYPKRYRTMGRIRPRRCRMITPRELREARMYFIKGDPGLLRSD